MIFGQCTVSGRKKNHIEARFFNFDLYQNFPIVGSKESELQELKITDSTSFSNF